MEKKSCENFYSFYACELATPLGPGLQHQIYQTAIGTIVSHEQILIHAHLGRIGLYN